MKNAETEIDFKKYKVTMLGQNQDLIITTAGHYAIPLRDKHVLEKILNNKDINIKH